MAMTKTVFLKEHDLMCVRETLRRGYQTSIWPERERERGRGCGCVAWVMVQCQTSSGGTAQDLVSLHWWRTVSPPVSTHGFADHLQFIQKCLKR